MLSQGMDADLVLVAQAGDFLLFQEQRFARLDADRNDSRFGTGFDGLRPDHRDIKAEILVRLGNFHQNRVFVAAEFTTTPDAIVGAFKSLDRENGSVTDYDGLTDIES